MVREDAHKAVILFFEIGSSACRTEIFDYAAELGFKRLGQLGRDNRVTELGKKLRINALLQLGMLSNVGAARR